MPLKYQQLIDDQNLTIQCPPADCAENERIEAVRWVVAPLENQHNFVPNHIYNSMRSVPPRSSMDEDRKCGYCSISFHVTEEASRTAFNALPPAIRSKIGYTHIAKGVIEKGWGLVTKANPITFHFELFEKEGYDWPNKFSLIGPISIS